MGKRPRGALGGGARSAQAIRQEVSKATITVTMK
jgi:hypothetical protein